MFPQRSSKQGRKRPLSNRLFIAHAERVRLRFGSRDMRQVTPMLLSYGVAVCQCAGDHPMMALGRSRPQPFALFWRR